MLPNEIKQELQQEFEAMNLKSTETLSEAFINGITVKGLRLSKDEKDTLAFYYLNFDLDLNNEEEKANIILDHRNDLKELEKENKLIKRFENTLSRLCGDNMEGYVREDFYTYEIIMEGINYCGAVDYAKYWYNTRF